MIRILAMLLVAAVVSAEAAGQAPPELQALLDLAQQQSQQKEYAPARETLVRALDFATRTNNPLAFANVSSRLGLVSWQLGDAAGVRRHYRAAADNFGALGMRVDQANAMRNLTFAQDMSTAERAEVVEQAWVIVRDLDEPLTQGLILHHWGDLLNLLGDYALAVQKLEAADPLLRKAGTTAQYTALLTSMGRTYRLHGLTDKAIEVYTRILPVQEKDGDSRGLAQTMNAIAIAHGVAGRLDDAIRWNERALDSARRTGVDDLIATIENSMASFELEVGRSAQAVERLERLLSRPDRAGNGNIGYSLRFLAQGYLDLGRATDARTAADRALAAFEAVGNQEGLLISFSIRGDVRHRSGDIGGAIEDVDRALDIVERLRANAAPRDAMKQSFLESYAHVFEHALRMRAETGDWAGSLAITERGRARAFLDLLATKTIADSPSVSSPTGDLPSRVAVPAASLDEMRAAARRLSSTIVAYWVEAEATYVWIVTPSGSVSGKRVDVKADRIGALARQVWGSFDGSTSTAPERTTVIATRGGAGSDVRRDPRAPLRELYQVLLGPIAALLPPERGALLTIVPHGPVFGVPFAALIDGRGRYLIEQYRLHEVPSVAVLAAAAPRVTSAARSILLVADPSPMPSAPMALSPLPGARAEVQAIARLLPASATLSLVGAGATEARLRDAASSRTAIHLATHGVVADDRPFESFLALARGGAEPERDGRLEASEIYHLSMNADLVVLSGCRTATGRVTGDGIIGLSRAFFTAGARSVIATRWDVADEAARWLMPEFYRRWLRGASASAALRDAQLAFIAALRKGAVRIDTPLGELILPEHPALWAAPALLGQP